MTPIAAEQNEGAEGTATDFTFSVTLSRDVQGGFDVPYTTNDGTATLADGDYIDNDGTLRFPGAATSRTITVSVNGKRVKGKNVAELKKKSPEAFRLFEKHMGVRSGRLGHRPDARQGGHPPGAPGG